MEDAALCGILVALVASFDITLAAAFLVCSFLLSRATGNLLTICKGGEGDEYWIAFHSSDNK